MKTIIGMSLFAVSLLAGSNVQGTMLKYHANQSVAQEIFINTEVDCFGFHEYELVQINADLAVTTLQKTQSVPRNLTFVLRSFEREGSMEHPFKRQQKKAVAFFKDKPIYINFKNNVFGLSMAKVNSSDLSDRMANMWTLVDFTADQLFADLFGYISALGGRNLSVGDTYFFSIYQRGSTYCRVINKDLNNSSGIVYVFRIESISKDKIVASITCSKVDEVEDDSMEDDLYLDDDNDDVQVHYKRMDVMQGEIVWDKNNALSYVLHLESVGEAWHAPDPDGMQIDLKLDVVSTPQ